MEKLNGLIAAGFTPFKDGKINTEVIPAYAKYLERNGVTGVFVNGTTGESLSLTVDERLTLADAWLEAAPENLKVIVHVGHNSLPACQQMAARAQEKGAWAVSAMAPTFFKPDLAGLVDYIGQIAAAAAEIPFYYYHMPSMTGANFLMTNFLKAAELWIPNLAGIKYTWEDLMDFGLCMDFDGGKYDMVFGRDEILLCGLALGAKAAIGSTYNFAAPLYIAIRKLFEEGNLAGSQRLQGNAMQIIAAARGAAPRCDLSAIRHLTARCAKLDLGSPRAPMADLLPQSRVLIEKEADRIVANYLCN